ncbi:MAG: dienelactone hydrolase family protein [Acidobacteriia bacterium]|nr:dienelactone hydrolase family protein [Terriglobia bacterium]
MAFWNEYTLFQNRAEAGRKLAALLHAYANRKDLIVLGIPRGGVPVAFEVAKALHAPLDIFLSRKLGAPGQEELAFGALATGGTRVLDWEIIEAIGISEEQIDQITAKVKKELERRANFYRGARPPLKVEGLTVLLVDDGIATGSSMRAAIQALRQMKPARIVVAVPVAPQSTCSRLGREVYELICVHSPQDFYAIGQFYEDFSQTADEEVTELLRQAAEPSPQNVAQDDPSDPGGRSNMIPGRQSQSDGIKREVSIELVEATLEGTLVFPKHADGLVLFAHGSGSSRHSPRNRYVAQVLQAHGIATLLFDLLTRSEESVDQYSGELRFDIPFLAKRLVGATKWILNSPDTKDLKVGYFGASTGAGAALMAAAELPNVISAVVSRGGRPDLAGDALELVQVPTLLIVGGDDEPVIGMNREALAKLKSPDKKLVIVQGATHLFEESGTLEEVARIAAEWFSHHFRTARKPQVRSAAN